VDVVDCVRVHAGRTDPENLFYEIEAPWVSDTLLGYDAGWFQGSIIEVPIWTGGWMYA
jgi:hypothetical protein